MAKSKEKNKAIELRRDGKSIKEIAKRVKVAKSTVSLWCRDIKLTTEQINKLHKKMLKGGYKGRLKGARLQYKRRLEKIKVLKKEGLSLVGSLSDRDFFISGIALYWAEGARKGRDVKFSNSDPEMIKLMIRWFNMVWGINKNRLRLHIGINKIHRNRVEEVEKYWSRITGISRRQFTKTILIKAKNKKVYKNFPIHYGTLTLKIIKPVELHYQIIGMIEGLIKKVKR